MDVADRSSTPPPPLPPKTRKNINSSSIIATNHVIATRVTSSPAKTTVFREVPSGDNSVTPPPQSSQHDNLSFSFPEVRSLTLLSGQPRTESSSTSPHSITNSEHHVVKIRINPGDDAITGTTQYPPNLQQYPSLCGKHPASNLNKTEPQSLNFHPSHYTSTPAEGYIRINVSSSDVEHQQQHEEMVRRSTTSIPGNLIKSSPQERANPYFFYGSFSSNGMVISSGQSSPSDTLDSGTCSDLDGSTPPPLPKKKSVTPTIATVTVTVNGGGHRRTGSLTSSGAEVDSDDEGSNISCDSLNSSELNGETSIGSDARHDIKEIQESNDLSSKSKQRGDLKNGIDASSTKLNGSVFKYQNTSPTSTLSTSSDDRSKKSVVEEKTYEERQKETAEKQQASSRKLVNNGQIFDTDRFYTFHLNEHATDSKETVHGQNIESEETFAGFRDLLQGKESSSTIRSSKGTVRGVKNRVRAGIATFLQFHDTKVAALRLADPPSKEPYTLCTDKEIEKRPRFFRIRYIDNKMLKNK
ncbi:hypothetical protein B7P43_G13048 [Cryptotermes secundus]|uniref:Uncharacterized protein n=1 Tax=Cryptotermes secundus TaxID=105785 RepID=A0A2J7R4K1_9NEOP|nr:hypothetical protein B7P43_G13048 [Cryptotermes secundus]